MGEIISLHPYIASGVDQAWERYRALAKALQDDPGLSIDRRHCEATIRAWERFRRLYLATAEV